MAYAFKKSRIGGVSTAAVLATGFLGLAGTTVALLPATTAHAQVPFHILRPATGASVRELVRIQFTRPSLGEAKYVQLIIDGRFRSAVAIPPPPGADGKGVYTEQIEAGKDRVFLLWNTKAIDTTPNIPEDQRTVQDGPHTIEVIALDGAGRRIGRDTVTVNVDNRIPTPADGVVMNYKFSVGDSTTYTEKAQVNFISAVNQTAAGGGNSPYGGSYGQRPYYGSARVGSDYGDQGANPNDPTQSSAITSVQTVRAKFERSVEDYLGSNVFFIRDKVVTGVIQGSNNTAAFLDDVYDFKSRYRTVESSGAVRDSGKAARPGAYIALLLPNLGGGVRRVGNSWKTRTPIQLEWATLDAPPLVYADNTFDGMEWQDGYQTARIHQKYDGKVDMPIYGGAGVIKDAKVSMDRTIWFGYKAGKIVRMETNITVEGDAPQALISAVAPGAGQVPGGIGGPGGYPGGGYGGGGYPGGFPGKGGFDGPGGGFPGAPGGSPTFGTADGGGLLGATPGGQGGGFGALQTQKVEEQRVPAKFTSNIIVTLDRYTAPTPATATKVATKQ